ncbi:MAG: peptide deformylase [Faecalibacterium sp.]|nr:peptide deformylase [Faecalibacterium sp.]
MVQPIMQDVLFLARKARPAVLPDDIAIADDLLATLRAHAEGCVGMAANMIGQSVAIIAFDNDGVYEEMFNPIILKQSGVYLAEEGCLSLQGTRPVKRCRSIKVQWQTRAGKPRIKTFTGFTAQIIQHEIDHLNGIII